MGSLGAVLPICGEQEFLAGLKREGYTCEMPSCRTKSDGSHSSLCPALLGSTLPSAGWSRLLAAWERQCWHSMVIGCPSRP
jgi:hypothetical protein